MINLYRHPLSPHLSIYPFESLHRFYVIRQHLVNNSPIIYWSPRTFPSDFGPSSGVGILQKLCDFCLYITTFYVLSIYYLY